MTGLIFQSALNPGPVFPLLSELQNPAQLYAVSVEFPLNVFLLLVRDFFKTFFFYKAVYM